MPRMDMYTRRRVVHLRSLGYSIAEIRKRFSNDNISISAQALFNLIKKHHETGKLLDFTHRARPRKLSQEMMEMLNEAMSSNDELTARQACDLLTERWPGIRVSLQTIKRVRRKELGWVCTKPHYCQLLRDVSSLHKYICVAFYLTLFQLNGEVGILQIQSPALSRSRRVEIPSILK